MTKFVGLCGRMGSGKDTAASFLKNNGYTRIAFADSLKEFALILDPIVVASHGKTGGIANSRDLPTTWVNRLSKLVNAVGWDEAKKSSDVRTTLQILGTEICRVIDPDCWVKLADKKVREICEFNRTTGLPEPKFVFSDLRFMNEADYIKKNGGLIVFIDRQQDLDEQLLSHSSESFDGRKYADHIIVNDGTLEDLENEILDFCGLYHRV